MGQLDPLISTALGRSPYEDELHFNPTTENGVVQTGQQYDSRARPINPASVQSMRDLVRASNEVMQTAGIIEETSLIRARLQKERLEREMENEKGQNRREIGQSLIVLGVWGVCGLRRRTLVYRDYATRGILDILHSEWNAQTLRHDLTAGLPFVLVYRAVRLYKQHVYTSGYLNRGTRRLLDIASLYVMFHSELFGVLTQLDILPARAFGSFLIPFSTTSPFRLKPSTNLLKSIGITIAPIFLFLFYNKTKNIIRAIVNVPLFYFLPKPINQKLSVDNDADEIPQERPSRRTSVSGPLAEHPATLRALEGRSSATRTSDDMSEDGDRHDIQTQFISFDVEATETTDIGTWSAELRNSVEPKPNGAYRESELTLFPAALATTGLATILTSIVLLPFEALLMRSIVYAWGGKVGGFGRQAVANLAVLTAAEVCITGGIWVLYTSGMRLLDYLEIDETSAD